MEIRIDNGNGRRCIITTRDQESRFACKINHVSSTIGQPYIGVNFDNEIPVGGRTMTEMEVEHLKKVAKAKGCNIVEM